jgi:hypothetical protein
LDNYPPETGAILRSDSRLNYRAVAFAYFD